MNLLMRLYVLALIITMLVVLSYAQNSFAAGTASGEIRLVFHVQPMCTAQGVLISVQDKADCNRLQKDGIARTITTNSDGSQIVTY